MSFFVQGIIILYAVHGFRSFLEWLPTWACQILRLDEHEFQRSFEKVEWWALSFIPPLIWAIATILTFSYISGSLFSEISTAHSAWNLAASFFSNLLAGTGVWIIISLWLLIFWVSRQPLNLQLSRETSKIFRPLASPSLYASASVFLLMFIVQLFYPPASVPELLINRFVILLGVLAFLVPFYNIHLVLVGMKRDELSNIDKQTNELITELNNAATGIATQDTKDRIATIMARLLATRIKGETVKEAQEWPVELGFLSAIGGMVVMSVVSAIIDFATRMLL